LQFEFLCSTVITTCNAFFNFRLLKILSLFIYLQKSTKLFNSLQMTTQEIFICLRNSLKLFNRLEESSRIFNFNSNALKKGENIG
jgi:hypothetical protein